MQVIPAVDLLGTAAVRLSLGDYDSVAVRRDPFEYVGEVVARRPALIHIVDLDGARAGAIRVDVVEEVISRCDGILVQVSGGVRDVSAAEALLAGGVARVVVGTAAFTGGIPLTEWVAALGENLVVAVDVRDGVVAVRGWREATDLTTDEALDRCVRAGVVRILGTAISRDGSMQGPDLSLYAQLCAAPLAVVAAGGIRDTADVAALERTGCEAAVVGRALYEGTFA